VMFQVEMFDLKSHTVNGVWEIRSGTDLYQTQDA